MNWTDQDRASLNAYLVKNKYRLIEYLRDSIEESDASTFEQGALQAREAKGERNSIKKILQAAEKQPERASTMEHVDVTVGIPK